MWYVRKSHNNKIKRTLPTTSSFYTHIQGHKSIYWPSATISGNLQNWGQLPGHWNPSINAQIANGLLNSSDPISNKNRMLM